MNNTLVNGTLPSVTTVNPGVTKIVLEPGVEITCFAPEYNCSAVYDYVWLFKRIPSFVLAREYLTLSKTCIGPYICPHHVYMHTNM